MALILRLPSLLTYTEHLSPARRADTLSGRTFVFHDDSLWILDLNLFSAFHARGLHLNLLSPKICSREWHQDADQSIARGSPEKSD